MKRDPFRLVEENGWFYARGASDDKAMAAVRYLPGSWAPCEPSRSASAWYRS